MITNLNNAKKIWRDNKVFEKSRCKRRYIVTPRPGRIFEKSLPIITLLKICLAKETMEEIKVNHKPVKDKRYPVCHLDYVQISGKKHQVFMFRKGKKHKVSLVPVKSSTEYYPVIKWFLRTQKCMVLTFQNKLFTFDIDEKNFDMMRKGVCLVRKEDEKIDLIQAPFDAFEMTKLTGKDAFTSYEVCEFRTEGSFIYMKLLKKEEDTVKEVKIHRSVYVKKYVLQAKKHIQLVHEI